MMKKKNKKGIWIAGAALSLVVAGFFGYRAWASNRAGGTETIQTGTVQRGDLASNLSSSGNSQSGQSATITWQTSGKVGEVTLKVGDLVTADQELASLDPNTLNSEMIQAKQELIDAQQALDDLLNSKTGQAKAQQAVNDAQVALADLKQQAAANSSQAQLALAEAQEALKEAERGRSNLDYPKTSNKLTLEKAETDYLLAKRDYKQALDDYQQVQAKKLTNPERVQALNRLVAAEQTMKSKLSLWNWYALPYSADDIIQADAELAVAQANLEKAQANWELYKDGSSSAAIALAEATLADAQREWERVKDGPNPADIEAGQAAVEAAQASLDHARLLSPFSGTITQVNVTTGDLVSPGDTAFRIDDLASIYVDLQVSEVDLASLKTGQPATLEFDAIPDKVYTGEVTAIGMVGTNSQGVVNYPVTVQITDTDADIRPGMTASVTIIVDQRQNVLLVPNRAIRTSGGQQTVTVLFEGQQVSVPVTVGLVGDSMSEVTSSQLREGDAVVINGTTSTASSNNQSGGREQFISGGMDGVFPAGGPAPGGLP